MRNNVTCLSTERRLAGVRLRGGVARRHPSSVDSSSWLRQVGPLAQAVEVLQQGVEATGSGTRMQVDAADLLDQLLQRLKLLQAQQ